MVKCHDELINIMSLFNFTKNSVESEIVLYEINFRWKFLIKPGLNEENKKSAINLLNRILTFKSTIISNERNYD